MKIQYGKIETMSKGNIQKIRSMIEDSLFVIMEDHGLKFELGNGSYDSDSVKFNGFRISLVDSLNPEEKALQGQIDFRRKYDGLVTLDDSIIAEDRGQQFKLVGFKPRARKKPFIIEDIKTSGRYVCSESMAERLFKEVK